MNLTGLFIKYLIYPYMEHRRGNRIRAYLAEMLADEKLPPGAIRELQDAKLRRLLCTASRMSRPTGISASLSL